MIMSYTFFLHTSSPFTKNRGNFIWYTNLLMFALPFVVITKIQRKTWARLISYSATPVWAEVIYLNQEEDHEGCSRCGSHIQGRKDLASLGDLTTAGKGPEWGRWRVQPETDTASLSTVDPDHATAQEKQLTQAPSSEALGGKMRQTSFIQ